MAEKAKISLKKKSKNREIPPWLQKILDFLTSPAFIGILITATFVFFARTFYQTRNQNKIDLGDGRISTGIFRMVEGLDFMLTDGRFLIRNEIASPAPVALLTIDDRSIEEIGRWPWSRDKIARVVDEAMRNGAQAIGFDIVFSEPQEDSRAEIIRRLETASGLSGETKALLEQEKAAAQPDDLLAKTVERYKDKLVLGAFPDESFENKSEPFTDYCRNEAFNRANASKFIKLENVSFVVSDSTDLFESVKFDELFTPIFKDIEQKTTAAFLKAEGAKTSTEQLTDGEKRKLQIVVNGAVMDYCDRWLSGDDPYGPMSEKFFDGLTKKNNVLKGMDFKTAIEAFTHKVLIYPMPQYRAWTINIDKIQDAGIYTASFAASQDNDGKIRNNPLFYRTGNRLGVSFVPSLALETYLASHPGYQTEVSIDYDPKDARQKIIKSVQVHDVNKDNAPVVMDIPVDGQGRLKINYAGGTRMFPYIPAKELLNDKPTMTIQQRQWEPSIKRYVEKDQVVKKADFLKGKSLIFGVTAVGVYDLRVTPFEKNFPGPETHLNVLANMMDNDFLRVDPDESAKMTWALIAFGLILSFGVAHAGAVLGFVIILASEIGLLFFDQWLLKRGVVTTIVLPVLLVISIYVLLTLYKYFTEERKKKHLRSTFAKYVSPAVVDEILKSPENIELGGKKQRMSVFFSDVRGFTTISEKLEPQVLSDVLNMYLTPMTEIVFANRGTLDKYMGDAVMAFFGAPIQFPDHAKYACRCALQSIEKLWELQKEFKEKGLPEIDIGIGINTSDMSVGNMGSNTVRSYTVMGDGVNLGSRLEGINKEYGTRIIISQFTWADVKDSFTCREVDWVRVKGKLEPVRIFELINEGAPKPDWKVCLEKFGEGFDLYHAKKFDEAKTKFQEALAARPKDPVSELYIERCDEYLQDMPPDNWDGVHVMKTK